MQKYFPKMCDCTKSKVNFSCKPKITHLNKSISFYSITQTHNTIMHEMFSWLSYIVKGRDYYMVTVHTETHTSPLVFTCDFACRMYGCYLTAFKGTLLQKKSHSCIKWGNKLVNGYFSKVRISSNLYMHDLFFYHYIMTIFLCKVQL